MYLTMINFFLFDVVFDVDDFDFFNIMFCGVYIYGFFLIVEFVFVGLVNIDLTYRVIRCVFVVFKYLFYGAFEFELFNLIDGDCDVGECKISFFE